ncbi:hypothetical protein [Streptomyces sp. NPDC050416]|uniref:hypothetical protein n=1 Tax=Streptomyces sp. NPDC050416 TaxID=3365611 RepID=UPI0037B5D0DA
MRTRTVTTDAVLLLALTACRSDNEPDAKPSPSKPATQKNTPKAAPSPDKPHTFGQTFTFTDDIDGVTMAITVLGYEQGTFHPQTSADQEFGTTRYTWAALEIKACLKKGTSGVTRYSGALAHAARTEPSTMTYGDFPKTEYPYEAKMRTGDCVRGKTVFAVPAKQRPERVLYMPEVLDMPEEWAVPKA